MLNEAQEKLCNKNHEITITVYSQGFWIMKPVLVGKNTHPGGKSQS